MVNKKAANPATAPILGIVPVPRKAIMKVETWYVVPIAHWMLQIAKSAVVTVL